MPVLVKVNNFVSAFLDALRSIFYIRLWTPFLILMLASAGLAYIILNPFSGPWSALVISIGKSGLFGGEEAFVHYPQHLLISPSVYSRVGLILAVFIDSLLTGTAFVMFAGFFSGAKVGFAEGIKKAFSRYHHLILVNIVIYVIMMAIIQLVPKLFTESLIGNPRLTFAFIVAFRTFMLFIFSFFIFAIPYVVLQNENAFKAILKSFKTFYRNFVTAFIAVFITQILIQPFSIGMDYGSVVAERFSPETISILLYLEIIATMIASFLLTAMVTRFFTEYHE